MNLNGYTDVNEILVQDISALRELHSILTTRQILTRQHGAIPALGRAISYLSRFSNEQGATSYNIFDSIDSTRALIQSLRESNVANLNNTIEITQIFDSILNIVESMQRYALYCETSTNSGGINEE